MTGDEKKLYSIEKGKRKFVCNTAMLSFVGLFDQKIPSITVEELVQSLYRKFICQDGFLTSDENHSYYLVQNSQQRWLTRVAARQFKIHLNNVTAVINSHLRLISAG